VCAVSFINDLVYDVHTAAKKGAKKSHRLCIVTNFDGSSIRARISKLTHRHTMVKRRSFVWKNNNKYSRTMNKLTGKNH